ncbi:MAG: diphthamide synthesis protein [Candidatus Pacearchaeota archaeon]|jgi:2-(3-amino-3-carboxypropyl)histidine synthase
MYNLELEKIISEIKKQNAKQVLIQLPDGLKPKAKEITDYIEKNTDCRVFIWLGTCFGGCDIPLGMDFLKIDLIFQFGHNKFNKEQW